MREMIAITFALRDESQDIARALQQPRTEGGREFPVVIGKLGGRETVIAHTGMGLDRVRERLPRLFEKCKVESVISGGYAGGLDPSLSSGALVLAENYSHPALLAKAQAVLKERCASGLMATSSVALETPAEKAAFQRKTGALAVDMETSAIAEICAARGVPLLSLRVITDAALEELAVPFSVCFDAKTERPRIASLLAFLLMHPARIPGFARFVGGVNRSRRSLTDAIAEVVAAI